MARKTGRRIGRGYTKPAGVVGGGNGKSQVRTAGSRQGQHPGSSRGTKRLGG